MKRVFGWLAVMIGIGIGLSRPSADASCCFVAPVAQEVKQPAQTAFVTWHPQERMETFTVEPTFTGNAREFGMIIPTPSRPRLYDMPREFFEELRIFTILKPTPRGKFRRRPAVASGGFGGPLAGGMGGMGGGPAAGPEVRVVESGQVGSLDYKIVVAEESGELFKWLKDNGFSFKGGEETLEFYIKQRWCFTVMKIDPMQQKRKADGTYTGAITPTRFVFATPRLVYPLRITQPNVTTSTDALFYVQAPFKADLPAGMGYAFGWYSQWKSAMSLAVPERLTSDESESLRWLNAFGVAPAPPAPSASRPARLEWAKRLDERDMGILNGSVRYDRSAELWKVGRLSILRGHLREGQWLTRIRKTFGPEEMTKDLDFIPATMAGRQDTTEYTYLLP